MDNIVLTTDFEQYKSVNEDNVIADSVNISDLKDDSRIGEIGDKKYRNEAFSANQPYSIINVYKADYPTGEYNDILANRGSDIYISSPYPAKYRKLCTIRGHERYTLVIQGAEKDGTWSDNWPICIYTHVGSNGEALLRVWDNYKSNNYKEYLLEDIYTLTIGTTFHTNNGLIGTTYGEGLLLTADKYNTLYKMTLPIDAVDTIAFKDRVILLGSSHSITINTKDLRKATGGTTLGDIDENGKIDTKDARLALLAYVGKQNLTLEQKILADVNKDGKVDTKDARQILLYYVGKIKKF
ncbi:MAG: hypothetical protein HFJ52_02445 [Clostridia bacterium]|nr:hypothetical protein [Clostridia bacterium]